MSHDYTDSSKSMASYFDAKFKSRRTDHRGNKILSDSEFTPSSIDDSFTSKVQTDRILQRRFPKLTIKRGILPDRD